MQAPPDLTDRAALARHRSRARAGAPAFFLHEEAADDLQERLVEVNRTFTAPALVTGFPEVWGPRFPGARLVPDAETLELDPGAHDLVVHALALHWASDPVGQLVQARRALAPDGLFLGVTFGGRTLNELRSALAEAEVRLTGGLSPRVAPMGEIRDLGALMQRAGFALPVADSAPRTVTYASLTALMHDLRAMGEQNALADRRRASTRRALFDEAARVYAETFPAGTGRIAATVEFVVLTGWSPGPGQPRPKRPGSATARLADALNTEEHPAGDVAAPKRRD